MAAWAIIVFIPQYIINTFGDGNPKSLYHFYTNIAIYGTLFYVNYLYLVPQLFLKNKKVMYFTLAALSILVLYFILLYIESTVLYDPERQRQFDEIMKQLTKDKPDIKPPIREFKILNFVFTSILISGFTLGLGVMDKFAQNEKQRKELEKEKLNSELAFLKNQISPHFFFNTLNNIYSLIGLDTKEAQESVLKLSKMMRYLLYESEQGETLLSHEISFMNNYIDLMKLRLSPRVELNVSFPVNFPDYKVPPLLFIPFIENAFKHGVSYREQSFIDIRMAIEKTSIIFVAQNSIGKSSQPGDGQHSGIGLENVRKRLNLLYPEKHQLIIENTNGIYRIELTIQTQNKQA
jgi:sensor histidine kinase YesM